MDRGRVEAADPRRPAAPATDSGRRARRAQPRLSRLPRAHSRPGRRSSRRIDAASDVQSELSRLLLVVTEASKRICRRNTLPIAHVVQRECGSAPATAAAAAAADVAAVAAVAAVKANYKRKPETGSSSSSNRVAVSRDHPRAEQ